TSPVVLPPASPPAAPTVTDVMSPPELPSAAQPHAVPLHLSSSPGEHVVISDSVTSPIGPPPWRPEPGLTAVMSPLPDRSGAQLTLPSELIELMKLPGVQLPMIRRWRSCTPTPPTASAFSAPVARIAYGTLSSEIRGSITAPSSVTCRNSRRPL